MSWPASLPTFVNGPLDAADLQALSDALAVLGDLTTRSYTPATSNLTLGNGTLTGSYSQVGDWITGEIVLTFGSTTAFTGAPTFTAPLTAAHDEWGADGGAFDSSTGDRYPVRAVATGAGTLTLFGWPTTAGGPLIAGANVPMAWAPGDILTISFRYRAA